MSSDTLETQLVNRAGQCVLTSPGSACFADLEGADRLPIGDSLRYFGMAGRSRKNSGTGIFGGFRSWTANFFARRRRGSPRKPSAAAISLSWGRPRDHDARRRTRGRCDERSRGRYSALPGGIVRSGSKVGSKYKAMMASTNDAYCPTLRGAVKTSLDEDIGCVLEIVIDGLTEEAVAEAMRAGLAAIVKLGRTMARCASAPAITAASSALSLSSEGSSAVNRLSSPEAGADQRLDLSPLVRICSMANPPRRSPRSNCRPPAKRSRRAIF